MSACCIACFFFFKQKTAYEMRISDWSSDVCSSDLAWQRRATQAPEPATATATGQRAIMVLPTRVEGPGDVAWARLGLMDYLADRIRRGGLPALSRDRQSVV